MSDLFFCAKNIKKSFPPNTEVLKGLDLYLKASQDLCILGESGAGKSTLLHILGGLERSDSGSVYFKGDDIFKYSEKDLSLFRNKHLGFVFQFHYLLNDFSALENVMLPCLIAKDSKRQAQQKATDILSDLNLAHRMNFYPSQLSGGEKQKVSLARALVQKPQILLADEPTGNLDSQSKKAITDLLFYLKKKNSLSLIVVSHDLSFSEAFSSLLFLKDGLWK